MLPLHKSVISPPTPPADPSSTLCATLAKTIRATAIVALSSPVPGCTAECGCAKGVRAQQQNSTADDEATTPTHTTRCTTL